MVIKKIVISALIGAMTLGSGSGDGIGFFETTEAIAIPEAVMDTAGTLDDIVMMPLQEVTIIETESVDSSQAVYVPELITVESVAPVK